jgi:phage shock protein E
MKRIVLILAILLAISSLAKEHEENSLIIDVRTPAEWDTGHVKNAKHIEWENIGKEILKYTKDKNLTIYVYCRSGYRSGKAKEILDSLGYQNVINAGGIAEARSVIIDLN